MHQYWVEYKDLQRILFLYLPSRYCVCVCVCVVILGFELRALYLLGKHSTI
jgi:hypothetical protein